jgi:hypothetical protein
MESGVAEAEKSLGSNILGEQTREFRIDPFRSSALQPSAFCFYVVAPSSSFPV